jgi:GNAT superfamily N-acetyltransferase
VTAVRRATSQDAEELTRLRECMFRDMGVQVEEAGWREACVAAFAERLGPDGDMAAFVVDNGNGGLASCAVGFVYTSLPGPFRPDGRTGWVLNIATEEGSRGRGYARASTTALLDWFHGHGVRRVELHATPPAEALARSLGFTQLTSKALTWAERRPVP